MKPGDLVTQDLLDMCSRCKSIVVLGYTKTGKLPIAKKISSELNIPLLIADNYQNLDDPLEYFMHDTLAYHSYEKPVVIEGILSFRLLRKAFDKGFVPDLIIKTECSENTIKHFYEVEGEGHKIPRVIAFNKGLNKIWNDFLEKLDGSPKQPLFIKLTTTLPQYL